MADLCMESYFITQIWWQPHAQGPLDIVGFSHNQEEQNEAFETLQELLGMEEEEREEEAMIIPGPKRIEVELKQKTGHTAVRHLVATSAIPPKGHFKDHSIGGRLYKNTTGELEKFKTSGMSSNIWKITCIKVFPGGISQPTTTHYQDFAIARQDAAWERVIDFLEGLQPSELKVIENWDHKASVGEIDDEDDMYGYGYGHQYRSGGMTGAGGRANSHWTNRTPSVYAPPPPPVAMLRLCGDEIGALLHRETAELDVSRPDREQKMEITALIEKKDEAEEEAEAETSAAEGNDNGGSSDDVSNGVNVYCDCSSPTCPKCQEEFETAAACLGGILPGVH